MNKLIITNFHIGGVSCLACAFAEAGKIVELRLENEEQESILGNIYMGRTEKVAAHIQAAFIQIRKGVNGYLPLKEASHAVYISGRRGDGPLRAGDELLVQVSRDAMRGKLPALTTNLEFPGKYLVLTANDRRISYSRKLSDADTSRLRGWMEEELKGSERPYGLIVRTNAGGASREELFHELSYLNGLWKKTVVDGIHRTGTSLLHEAEPFYLSAVRDVYSQSLGEIVTDIPEVCAGIREYLDIFIPEESRKLRFYDDKLLPLNKLYPIGRVLDEICAEKVWLKSGGFLVIQQTEAFVSIDVNSGKYSAEKNAEETYLRINLEAAAEIARQIRLRNLSGAILVDFINMKNPDDRDELFRILNEHLSHDPTKTRAVDVTPLQITEITRKKTRPPVAEFILRTSGRNPVYPGK